MRLSRNSLVLSSGWSLVVALFAGPVLAANHNVSVGPGNAFSPATVNINVGDTVTWNLLGGFHNVNSTGGLFTSGPVGNSWGSYTFEFNASGSFNYQCDAHAPSMAGVVNVTQGGGGGTPGALQFSTANVTVNEDAGTRTITVQRVGGDDGPVSVEYFTADGTAQFPGDYIQTNNTLNWADNDDDNKTFQVPIVDDGVAEGNESFTVRLESPTGGATLGAPSTITVTIEDDDGGGGGGAGTIRFTQATRSIAEAGGSISLTAERVNGTTGPVSAEYALTLGTAVAPGDYGNSSGELAWADGEGGTKSFTVDIVNDTESEGDETFSATLFSPTGGASIGSPATTTVTITDDDTNCVPTTCVSDTNNLCLAGGSGTPGRFRVSVVWTDFLGVSGPGVALPYTDDSGFFYFFAATNLELLVKVLNGCGFNDAYWFYYGAATNVGLVYTVTDLQTCQTRTLPNQLGNFGSDGNIGFFTSSCP